MARSTDFDFTKLHRASACQGQDESALKIFLLAESIFRLTLDKTASYARCLVCS